MASPPRRVAAKLGRKDHSHIGSASRWPGRWATLSRMRVLSTGSSPSWSCQAPRCSSRWCTRAQALASAVPYLEVSVTMMTAGPARSPAR